MSKLLDSFSPNEIPLSTFPHYHDEEVHLESLVEYEFHFPKEEMFKMTV